MLSIKKYMAGSPDLFTAALTRLPYAILEAIAAHSVKYDPVEYDKNRAALRKLRTDLESASNSTEVLEATGATVRTIESYNRAVGRYIEFRAQEMNTVVSMLVAKLQEMAEGNGASAEKLKLIGQKLEKAAQIEDVRVLKKALAESLQGVQQEAVSQKEHAAAIHTEARELKSKVIVPAASPVDSDAATGLPGPETAELAMQQAIASQVHTYIVLFAVGLGSVTRRFGYQHGDTAFAAFAAQIASSLGPADLLFRWKGPTLVALLERPDANDAAPQEMSRLAALQPEVTLEIAGRSTNVRLAMSSISFRLWKYDNLPAIRQALHEFQQTIAPESIQEPAAAKSGV